MKLDIYLMDKNTGKKAQMQSVAFRPQFRADWTAGR